MEEIFMSFDKLKIIEGFLQIATTIDSIYEKLYILEMNGQKNSDDYNKLLTSLKEAIKIEESKFRKANLSCYECMKIVLLLIKSKSMISANDLDCIILQKYDDRVIRRIINKLNYKITTSKEFQQKIHRKEVLQILQFDEKEFFDHMTNYSKTDYAIDADINYIFLSILLEFISNKKYNDYTHQLIKTKYAIAFIDQKTEKQLLTNNFDIPKSTYLNSIFTASLLGLSTQDYEKLKYTNIKIKLLAQIHYLLEITDSDYEKTEKNIESILRQCFIRAMISLLSDDIAYEINDEFHEYIDSDSYINRHQSDRISENAIMKCFKCIKHDREKTKVLTLQL